MKQEDTDWRVYHLIPPAAPVTVEDLAVKCGFEMALLEDSLARLERACLIERNGQEVRVLTFGESLIRNQVQCDRDLPFVIENGVIKERRR